MEIMNTEWTFESLLKLVHSHFFSREEYESRLKPDISLLKEFPTHEKFSNSKFWGLAKVRGKTIRHGYKVNYPRLKPEACNKASVDQTTNKEKKIVSKR